MLSMDEILWIVRNDEIYSAEISRDYSPELNDIIRINWRNVACFFIISAHLLTHSWNFRLSKFRGDNSLVNYWPSILKENPVLISYARSLVFHAYIFHRKCVHLNFSFTFSICDENETPHFLYSSASNYMALETSWLIHDDRSFNEFFDRILAEFSLENHLDGMISLLDAKYAGEICPISITFYAVKNVAQIYGSSNRRLDKKSVWNNNCLFESLSMKYTIKTNKVVQINGRRAKKSRKRAILLRKAFKDFMSKNHKSVQLPVSTHGFKSEMMSYVEDFLKAKVYVYSLRYHVAKRVSTCSNKLQLDTWHGKKKQMKELILERNSEGTFPDVVNLLLTNGNHIETVLNIPRRFGFYCNFCNGRFYQKQSLTRHMCVKSERFRQCQVFPMRPDLHTSLKTVCNAQVKHLDSPAYAYIAFSEKEEGIEMQVNLNNDTNHTSMTYSFKEMEKCVQFLINFLKTSAQYFLSERLMNNAETIRILDLIVKTEKPNPIMIGRHGDIVRYQSILKVRSGFMEYLSYIKCYVSSNHCDTLLLEKVMNCILLHYTTQHPKSEIETRNLKGKLGVISVKKTGLIEIQALNYHASVLIPSENVALNGNHRLRQVMNGFQEEFKIDMTNCSSPADLGLKIISSCLRETQKQMFLSPYKDLCQDMKNMVRYGIFTKSSGVIHKDGNWKTAVMMDFNKFYVSIISSIKPWIGVCIKYEKQSNEKFTCNANRKRSTLSNLFFMYMSRVVENGTDIHFSGSHGYEQRQGVQSRPVDAVMVNQSSEVTYLQFLGCFWHIHGDIDDAIDKEAHVCHQGPDTQPRDHSKKCDLCKNAQQSSHNLVKPSLFRFRVGENMNSRHRVRKHLSYREMYEKEEEYEKSNISSNKFIRIRECRILRFFNRKAVDFFDSIGVKIRKECEHILLGKAFYEIVKNAFPLTKFLGKLGESTLIHLIKLKKVSGYVRCSVEIGEEGKNFLQPIRPLSYKDSKNNVVRGYEMYDELVSTNFLSVLLREEKLHVKVFNVKYFYEYSENCGKLFSGLKTKVMTALSNQSLNIEFCKYLKVCMNAGIGLFGVQSKYYARSVLVDENDLLSLSDMVGFKGMTPISDNYSFMHFNGRNNQFNLCHLHCQIINEGASILLSLVFKLKSFLCVSILSTNCDSVLIVSDKAVSPKCLENSNSCLAIDSFLHEGLSHDELNLYIDWKFEIFAETSVCLNHKREYCDALLNKYDFILQDCCKHFKNTNVGKFSLNIEIVANCGVVTSPLQMVLYNSCTNDKISKKTGQPNFVVNTDLTKMSFDELKHLITI